MKTAVVTGGMGFIGRRLVERMIVNGWRVLVVDDMSTHEDKTSFPTWEGSQAYMSIGRVQDHTVASIAKQGKPDLIVHLAGKVGPLGVLKFKGKIAKDTIDANSVVADWALHYECPLIDISTSEVYGDDSKKNSEWDKPVIQHPSARSEYAVSKLAAEHMLMNTDGLDVKIVRPFNIAGYGQRADGGFVIPRFIEQAFKGDDLTVYWPGHQQRSFTHVDDFLDGLAIVYAKGDNRTVYNIGSPWNTITIHQLAIQIASRIGSANVSIVRASELHGKGFVDAPDKIPNAELLALLGWVPYRSTGEIIQDSIRYYREKRYEGSGVRLPDTEQTRPYAEDAW